ncbi:MAG TPA: hypothetical protein VIF62_39860 [Labilithrix sp.]|jgi:hypothetical protein
MKLVAALAPSVLLAACSSGSSTAPGETPPANVAAQTNILDDAHGAEAQTRGPVIATVVTRDAKVAVVGGGAELRFVVRKQDGTLVADGLTSRELHEKDPFLSIVVESAVAGAGGGSYVDATGRKLEPAKAKLIGDIGL